VSNSGLPAGTAGILRNAGWLFSARSIAQIARLVYAVLVVRALGPVEYGVLAYVHAWGVLLLPAINMGSQPLLSKSFGHAFSQGKDLAQRLWTLRLLTVPILVLGMLAVSTITEPDLNRLPLFMLVGAAVLGRGMAIWANHVLVANHRAASVLRLEAGFRLGETALAGVALYGGMGIPALLIIHASLWIMQAMVSGSYIAVTLFPLALRWSDLQFVALVKQGVVAMVPGSALIFLLQAPLIFGRHMGSDSVPLGQLALALQVIQVLVAVPASIGVAALPVLARDGKGATSKRYRRVLVPLSIGVALLIAFAGAVWGEVFVAAVFGSDYLHAAAYLVSSLLLLFVPLAPTALLTQSVVASDHENALRDAALPALAGIVCGGFAMLVMLRISDRYEMLLLGSGAGAFTWFLLLILRHIFNGSRSVL
jgi:O-antigen/teichoic acid export membrane protein